MKRLFAIAVAAMFGVTMAGCAMSDEGSSANASHRAPGITSESMSGPHHGAYATESGGPNSGGNYLPGITGQSIVGPYGDPNYLDRGGAASIRQPVAPGITGSSFNGPNGPDTDDATTAGYQAAPGK
jgi:hypothetical protein